MNKKESVYKKVTVYYFDNGIEKTHVYKLHYIDVDWITDVLYDRGFCGFKVANITVENWEN